jgi:Tol biopolymer transport system component
MSGGGGPAQQVTQGLAVNFDGRWSRDGASLYFCSTRTGRDEIWKMPAGGGPATQITHNTGSGSIVSPDGKTLFFAKEVGEGSVWKMPIDGGPEVQLTHSLYRTNFAVTTRGIYYMSYPGKDGKSALKFYDLATGKSTLILNIGYPEFGLDVSPNGRYLAYAQLDDPGSVLMLVENFR